jgi:hypothetical protein
MSAPAEGADAPRWYQPGIADLVFVALAVVVFNGARTSMLNDPGLGWHLRNIDAMIAEGGWLTHDPFSGPRHGEKWLTNQWLGELPLWLGKRWAGLEGIAAVTALTLALMLRCLFRMLMRDGLPWTLALVWTGLAALGTSFSWVARPNIFTMLFVLLTARVCVLFHEGRVSRAATLWLLPLFAVWANCHGGFVAGLMMLGAVSAAEAALAVVAAAPERREAWGRAIHFAALLAGAVAATLINPYGLHLYKWVLGLLGNTYFMDLNDEWKSPDFHRAGLWRFELLLLLLPVLFAFSRYRPNAVEVILCVVWLHFALGGFRYVPLFVLVIVPVLARCSRQLPWPESLAERVRQEGDSLALFTARPGRAPWVWSAVVAVAFLVAARGLEGRVAAHDPKIIPVAALDRLIAIHRERGPETVVFHGYNWGGYLTWKGWPRLRTWIDDRNEVQGEEHCKEFFRLQDGAPDWREVLDRARVELVCIPVNVGLDEQLAEETKSARGPRDWREVYRDDYAVIFERDLSLAGP